MKFKDADRMALESTFPSDRWWRVMPPYCGYYWLKVILIYIVGNAVESAKGVRK